MLILEKSTCDLRQVSLMLHQKCSSSKQKTLGNILQLLVGLGWGVCSFGLGFGVFFGFLKINQTCSLKPPF